MSTNSACPFSLGMSEKKQTSYKVLMGLIVLMFILQTIHNVCDWYIVWLGFIRYGNAPDQRKKNPRGEAWLHSIGLAMDHWDTVACDRCNTCELWVSLAGRT
jgi:hypothetical protein